MAAAAEPAVPTAACKTESAASSAKMSRIRDGSGTLLPIWRGGMTFRHLLEEEEEEEKDLAAATAADT